MILKAIAIAAILLFGTRFYFKMLADNTFKEKFSLCVMRCLFAILDIIAMSVLTVAVVMA